MKRFSYSLLAVLIFTGCTDLKKENKRGKITAASTGTSQNASQNGTGNSQTPRGTVGNTITNEQFLLDCANHRLTFVDNGECKLIPEVPEANCNSGHETTETAVGEPISQAEFYENFYLMDDYLLNLTQDCPASEQPHPFEVVLQFDPKPWLDGSEFVIKLLARVHEGDHPDQGEDKTLELRRTLRHTESEVVLRTTDLPADATLRQITLSQSGAACGTRELTTTFAAPATPYVMAGNPTCQATTDGNNDGNVANDPPNINEHNLTQLPGIIGDYATVCILSGQTSSAWRIFLKVDNEGTTITRIYYQDQICSDMNYVHRTQGWLHVQQPTSNNSTDTYEVVLGTNAVTQIVYSSLLAYAWNNSKPYTYGINDWQREVERDITGLSKSPDEEAINSGDLNFDLIKVYQGEETRTIFRICRGEITAEENGKSAATRPTVIADTDATCFIRQEQE